MLNNYIDFDKIDLSKASYDLKTSLCEILRFANLVTEEEWDESVDYPEDCVFNQYKTMHDFIQECINSELKSTTDKDFFKKLALNFENIVNLNNYKDSMFDSEWDASDIEIMTNNLLDSIYTAFITNVQYGITENALQNLILASILNYNPKVILYVEGNINFDYFDKSYLENINYIDIENLTFKDDKKHLVFNTVYNKISNDTRNFINIDLNSYLEEKSFKEMSKRLFDFVFNGMYQNGYWKKGWIQITRENYLNFLGIEVKEVVEENEVTEEVVTKENINIFAEKILAIFTNKTSLSLESCQVLIKDFYRKLTSKFNEKLSKKTIKAIEENIYIYRTFTYNFLLNVFNKIQEVSFVYTIENNIKQIDSNKLEEWMQCQLTSEEFTRMKKSCLNKLNKPFELPKSYNKEDLTLIKDFKRDFNNIISFIPTNERKYNNINFIENALTIATKGNFIKYTTYNNKGGFSVNISEFKKSLDNIKTDCVIKAGCINNISFDYSERTLDAPVIEKDLTEKGNVKKIVIDSIELRNALKNCLPICLKEKEDSRKQLQMPCLYFDKNKSYLLSTDAKQIIKYDLDIINNTYFDKAYNLYIPFDIAKGLLYNLENHKYTKGEDGWPLSEKVEIIFNKNCFEIIFNELNIICSYININPIDFTPCLNEVNKCQIIFNCNSNDLFKICENATQHFTEDIYKNPIKAFAFIYNGKELILKNDNARFAIPTFKLNDNIGFNAFNPALIANVLKNKNIDITVYIANKEEKNIPLFIKYLNYTYVLMPVFNDFQEIAKNELTEVNKVKEVVEENEVKEEVTEVKKVNTGIIKQVIITVLKSLVNIKTSLIKYIIIRETKEKELLIIHNITKRSRPPPEVLKAVVK